jgi:small subunit ribosomal protein S7
MRRKVKNRNIVKPDFVHNSQKVAQLINYTMNDGKKNTARKCVYGAFDIISEKHKQNPIDVLELALRNTGPTLEVRSRRIGGATYQVPREVRPERRQALAFRWILTAARSRKGMPMKNKLAEELMAASKNEGEAVKKRENTHKMAEANRAFAHFAW